MGLVVLLFYDGTTCDRICLVYPDFAAFPELLNLAWTCYYQIQKVFNVSLLCCLIKSDTMGKKRNE